MHLRNETMNPDTFNMSIRKFLKTVGVHSQREIETAVERARAAGKLQGNETLNAKMRLTVDGVDLNVDFDGKISLE
jgi:ribosomal protein L1